ncbi:MAG: rubrerythrin family protein [Thermoproteota archaeon]|nr:MAG: rubrerythrin family protein [Candidatus Korarchaeota archaeon]
MKKMTEEFLKAAFSGESQAHMKYLIFAEKAEEEGLKNIARLFRAIAYAEYVHARNHLKELGMVGVTKDNLQAAIEGETYEVQEMYPVYNNTAKMQGEKGAERSTKYALEAEKIHAALYSKAKQTVIEGKDIEIRKIYICPKCGYTVEGEPPERCPVCGLPREKFKEF